MNNIKRATGAALVSVALGTMGLAGCTNTPFDQTSPTPTASQGTGFVGYGVVEGINVIKTGSGDSNNLIGTLIGGVVGGAVGSQIGSGRGQTAATVVGAVGGAVAGHEIQKRTTAQQDEDFDVRVRMDNGGYQTVRMPDSPGLAIGERVSVYQNAVYKY
jgi:outer membrane lipoprotein SlyB